MWRRSGKRTSGAYLVRQIHKSLVHDPTRTEKNELNLIYSSLIQLRQEIGEIRQMLQQVLTTQPSSQPSPLLLPPYPAEACVSETPLPEEPTVPLEETEKRSIAAALRKFGGNKRKTAQMLGINERTLYRKIKEYNL